MFLNIVFNADNGDVKDDCFDLGFRFDAEFIKARINNFVSDYFWDGYGELNPNHYIMSDMDINNLLDKKYVSLNGGVIEVSIVDE